MCIVKNFVHCTEFSTRMGNIQRSSNFTSWDSDGWPQSRDLPTTSRRQAKNPAYETLLL